MKLYVCWGTFAMPAHEHPCHTAHKALLRAGHDPEVIRSYGWTVLPDALNFMPGRREARRLTGKTTVPVLVTDGGEVIAESDAIARWSAENPATA